MNSRFVHLSVFAVFSLRGFQADCNTGFNGKDGEENVLFCVVYGKFIGYLKNHWVKHMLICIHSDAFEMLNSNMLTLFKTSSISKNKNVK